MADVLRTFGTSTGDSSDLEAAITWGQNSANYDRGAGDDVLILRGIVDEIDTVSASVDVDGFTGTPTSSKYCRLETTEPLMCKGKYQGVRFTKTSGGHVFSGCEDFLHVKGIAVKQGSTGSSNECWRVAVACTDVVFEKCYMETGNTTQQDCLYGGSYQVNLVTVFDCMMVHGGPNSRVLIHGQHLGSGGGSHLWRIEHCTMDANNVTGTAGGIGMEQGGVGETVCQCWNTLSFNGATAGEKAFYNIQGGADFVDGNRGNISQGTDSESAVAAFGAGANNFEGQTFNDVDEADTDVLIEAFDSDWQLLLGASATNVAVGNALDGGVRDARIDTTVDIAGNARPTYATGLRDSGAFQVAGYSVGRIMSSLASRGGLAGKGGIAGIGGGLAA